VHSPGICCNRPHRGLSALAYHFLGLIQQKPALIHALVVDVSHRDADDLGLGQANGLLNRQRDVFNRKQVQKPYGMTGLLHYHSHTSQAHGQGEHVDVFAIGGDH
jgi:hypothetical protein